MAPSPYFHDQASTVPSLSLEASKKLQAKSVHTKLMDAVGADTDGVTWLNVAVTLRAVVIDTQQAQVPVQAPLQPSKVDPVAGVAVSETNGPTP